MQMKYLTPLKADRTVVCFGLYNDLFRLAGLNRGFIFVIRIKIERKIEAF